MKLRSLSWTPVYNHMYHTDCWTLANISSAIGSYLPPYTGHLSALKCPYTGRIAALSAENQPVAVLVSKFQQVFVCEIFSTIQQN